MSLQILLISLCIGILTATRTGDLTFTKISRIIKNDADHFEIEVENGVGNSDFDHFHLNFLSDSGANQFSIDSVAKTKTKATFKGNLNDYASQEVRFELTQRDDSDDEVKYGDLIITLPAFPTTAAPAWVGVTNDFSLRIANGATINGFKYNDKDCTESDGTPCYFIDVSKPVMGPEEFCILVDEVSVCDKTLTVAPVPGTRVDPDTAELSYRKDGAGADIIVTVTHSYKAISSTEVLVYKEDGTIAKACTSTTCTIGKITLGDVFTVITVGIDTDIPADTGSQQFNDYELVGNGLSTTLLEIRWTKPTEYKKFKAHRDDGTPDGGLRFTDTIVTCEDAPADKLSTDGVTHCFAYFTELDGTKKYDATITSMDDMDVPQDTNKVTLKLTDMPDAEMEEDMKMGLSSLTTKWNKGLRSFEVNACVNRVDSTDLSSYEAILINNIGQWKKIHGLSQRSTQEFCFEELNVDVHNFNISDDLTLVVAKRANDGITVLQSVETVISV